MNNTIKVSDEVIRELRMRKAKFEDKTIDATLRHMLGMGHVALNPPPTTADQMNPARNQGATA